MRAALALEIYSLSSFMMETISFFSAEVLPVLDGIFFSSTDKEEP